MSHSDDKSLNDELLLALLKQADEESDRLVQEPVPGLSEGEQEAYLGAEACLEYLGRVRELCHRESIDLRDGSTFKPSPRIKVSQRRRLEDF